MLNNNARTVLKSLIPINNSQIIEPVSYFRDEFKTIIGRVNYEEIDSEIKDEFGIFDTANFLGSLDLLEDPKITLNNNQIIADDGVSKLTFITSDISSLDIDVKPSLIDRTLEAKSVLELDIDPALLGKIKKASSVFKTFDTLFIINKDNETEFTIGAKNSFSQSNNAFTTKVQSNISEKDFDIALPLESLLKIPSMDYKFIVKYNEEKDTYRIALTNEILTFILSLMK